MALVSFTIRDLQAADFETLWRIDQDCFPPGISYSRAELKAYMRRSGAFTCVAVEDGIQGRADAEAGKSKKYFLAESSDSRPIAGFVVAETAKRASGHVVTIDVVKASRRSGVGSLLLQAAEDRLRTAGSRVVELETAVDNLSALSFYKRHAYRVVGTFPRYYSNGVDALVLQKNLAEK
jgi:ribosomal-protein-alanine N-acetyltransferase